MTPEQAVAALTELAARAGIDVRVEPFTSALAGKGGLCRIEGRSVLLVDARLGALEQAGVLGLALRAADLRDIEVPWSLVSYLRTGHAPIRPVARPRPLARARHLRVVPRDDAK